MNNLLRKLSIIIFDVCLFLLIACTPWGTGDEPSFTLLEDAAIESNITSFHAIIQPTDGSEVRLQLGEHSGTQSLYGIGSISKSFVAVLVLKLQEEGHLHLEDKVSSYLPDLTLYDNRITIQDLLTMRSGIADYMVGFDTEDYFKEYDRSDLIQRGIADSAFESRGTFLYSNTNILIMIELIERVMGQRCEALIQEKILDPLRLDHTYFASQKATIRQYIVPGYSYTTAGEYLDFTDTTTSWALLSCGMYASADDMAAWLGALAHDDFLSEASRSALYDILPIHEDLGYGLCIMHKKIHGVPMTVASGNVPGYSTAIAFNESVCITLLCNLSDYSGSYRSYAEDLIGILIEQGIHTT